MNELQFPLPLKSIQIVGMVSSNLCLRFLHTQKFNTRLFVLIVIIVVERKHKHVNLGLT